MATNLPSCFFIQFLEQLLKFLVNFTLLKYVKSQRSYGFLITKELIFGFQILDLKDHFSGFLRLFSSVSVSQSLKIGLFYFGKSKLFCFKLVSTIFRLMKTRLNVCFMITSVKSCLLRRNDTYFQWTEDRQGFQIEYLTLDAWPGSCAAHLRTELWESEIWILMFHFRTHLNMYEMWVILSSGATLTGPVT